MKNVILVVSVIGSLISFITRNSVNFNICEKFDYPCRVIANNIEHINYSFVIILVFSLITYKLPETISRAWVKYCIFSVPIVLFISTYINLGFHHNPNGSWQNIFDPTMLWTLYILFSIGSIIAIFIGWRKHKKLK
jgi:hypothetical protein